MLRLWMIVAYLFGIPGLFAQDLKTKNIIIVTIDGFRWTELFDGAQENILGKEKYVKDERVRSIFGGEKPAEKRTRLMPFMWDVVAKQGQLYGNRHFKNRVNCANNRLLSYPGYSEMFVGYPEKKITSNDAKINPNATVFDHIQLHEGFEKEVVAFATWDVFPYILREGMSSIHVNAGSDIAVGNISSEEKKLNEFMNGGSKRDDGFTFGYAFEYLKREKPRVTFIGFDETDYNAHLGKYDSYLRSANEIDSMLNRLWTWVQSDPNYKDQTTLFITTDHGRGHGKHTWTNHRLFARGSRHIWFAVMGPDTPAFGELRFKGKYYQKQIARTVAAFLGIRYHPGNRAGSIIQTMIARPMDPIARGAASEKSN
jgi:hypothetical protein